MKTLSPLRLLLAALPIAFLCSTAEAAPPRAALVRLPGHLSAAARAARAVGRVEAASPVRLAVTLPLRNQAALSDLLRRLYDPSDPLHGQYLTAQQFAERFGPTQADYDTVAAYARAQGLSVVGTHPNRTILDVSGPAATVERAFGVRLLSYRSADGKSFQAPDAEPAVPAALAGKIRGVVGLDTAAVRRPHALRLASARSGRVLSGTGPNGGRSPQDIRNAYNLGTSSTAGAGQTLAAFELDTYRASDITTYEDTFGLPHVPLQNVLVDGGSSPINGGPDEVTLDIELLAALAPGASKILVYQGPNSDAGTLDMFNRIATDNLAKQVCFTWGLPELMTPTADLDAENTAFQQMAAQGQSAFAAAGDSGAYDDNQNLSVDDPASQPYMTGVGATTLSTVTAGGAYQTETPWNAGSIVNGAGGGGISAVWPIPSWQQGLATAANLGSRTMRNVPDVSLNGDPQAGYAIYFQGKWYVYGGTSCTAPLWAGLTAQANQQRLALGQTYLGFLNPTLYSLAQNGRYAADFHDVGGGTNLFYPAVAGYDLATGLGTPNGANLLVDLAPTSSATPVPGAAWPAGLNFISLPGDYSGTSLDTLFGYTGVRLAVWNPAQFAYALTPTVPANLIQPGLGYWITLPTAVAIRTAGASVPSPVSVTLAAGWNQIGNPFGTAVPVSSLTAVSGGQTYAFAQAAGSAGLLGPTLYSYSPAVGGYATVSGSDSLQPGQGYWVRALQSVTLQIPTPGGPPPTP